MVPAMHEPMLSERAREGRAMVSAPAGVANRLDRDELADG